MVCSCRAGRSRSDCSRHGDPLGLFPSARRRSVTLLLYPRAVAEISPRMPERLEFAEVGEAEKHPNSNKCSIEENTSSLGNSNNFTRIYCSCAPAGILNLKRSKNVLSLRTISTKKLKSVLRKKSFCFCTNLTTRSTIWPNVIKVVISNLYFVVNFQFGDAGIIAKVCL